MSNRSRSHPADRLAFDQLAERLHKLEHAHSTRDNVVDQLPLVVLRGWDRPDPHPVGTRMHMSAPTPGGSVGWVCTTAGVVCDNAWAPTTPYQKRDAVFHGTEVYVCYTPGVSAAGPGPSGEGIDLPIFGSTVLHHAVYDGAVLWVHAGARATFKTFGAIDP